MKISKIILYTIAAIYYPIYVAFWLLHKIARLFLALTYYGQLNFTTGSYIIKWLFK